MVAKEVIDLSYLNVVKRNLKKVEFDGTKIALAIKKAFDSLKKDDDEDTDIYNEKDINKVYKGVIKNIEKIYKEENKIKIEDIQDLIEEELKKQKYDEVHSSFSNYRERRANSRINFSDEKKLHKFLKTIESLGLKSAGEDDAKRENANIDGDTAMGTMLQYGSTVSKEFAKSYLMKPKYAEAHDNGVIHIHDMDFLAMGTVTCCHIDLARLYKGGFDTGHGYIREPNDISTYGSLAAIAIQSNQNDQHGGQSVPAFDYYMAPGVLKTFKKEFKQAIYNYLDFTSLNTHISMQRVAKEIDKLDSIEIDLTIFDNLIKGSDQISRIFHIGYENAFRRTERAVSQAMQAFIHNLNTMHSRAGAQVPFSSINFGTDVSPEGRMVIKNLLNAIDDGLGNGETPIFPVAIFKVKEGINYNPEDVNYDLFKQACKVSAKRLFPNFSFIDAPFNKKYYKEGDINTEIAYMGCRTRIIGDVTDRNNEVVTGRGNLSWDTINLPRLGIKHGIALKERNKADMKAFYTELDEIIDMIKDQLLERFEFQCSKKVYNFPFLLGQGVWTDGDKLKLNDRIRKVLKHGSLGIGFIGLAECLKALIGIHHGEDKKAQKLGLEIITHIKARCDELAEKYNLNFTCLATPAEGLAGRFTSIDKSIYGKIAGVTDRAYYTNSFHVPVHYKISISDKIKIEAPYHAQTNGGHISYIELDGDVATNITAFENVIRLMKESGIGYGAINHPVDRDPVCGYIGVIGDTCPKCGRKEYEGIPIERLN